MSTTKHRPGVLHCVTVWGCVLCMTSFLRGETLVLNDGTVIEGEIMTKTASVVRVRTVHGVRPYKLKDIKQILASTTDITDLAKDDFSALPDVGKEILNARARYHLGEYPSAIDGLRPHLDPKGTDWNQMLIRWILVESYERLADFDEAKAHLNYIQDNGAPQDRMRAEAHLEIFKDNPAFDLRVIGKKFARYFLTPEMELKAKDPKSLAKLEIMDAALKEYCDQLLEHDEISVEAFRQTLDVEETLRSVAEKPSAASVAKGLPYFDRLRKVEAALYRVQAVIPQYGDAYELDLVRTEAEHILEVLDLLFGQTLGANPETFVPPSDANTGQLTPEGRQQWRERCEEFLRVSKPVVDVTEYFLEKLERYPKDLREMNKIYSEILDRLTQMRQLAVKRKERSHV